MFLKNLFIFLLLICLLLQGFQPRTQKHRGKILFSSLPCGCHLLLTSENNHISSLSWSSTTMLIYPFYSLVSSESFPCHVSGTRPSLSTSQTLPQCHLTIPRPATHPRLHHVGLKPGCLALDLKSVREETLSFYTFGVIG